MDQTRPLRPIVKRLVFPIACIACAIWIAAFVVIFQKLPQRSLGIGLLVVLSGAIMMIPWMAFVVGILKRMQGKEARVQAGEDHP
jgi:hypothetical protein